MDDLVLNSNLSAIEDLPCRGVDKRRICQVSRWRAHQNCGLWYHSIVARVGRDPMTVSRIWNQWAQDGNTEHRAGSQRPPTTTSREDRHVTRKPLMDHTATSRAMSQELGSFAR
ncbi:HTH_Tnp_Tc3_2 domain-containing protein [Trichonephila clavipes]|uniref:HTH_Tnp_Tc3_2 domain-containing protein n=1 Tax=Trichonephila clavipes TaxID=2585209 RepID=A0A8X6VVN2_TRICX|nr:HTH_Tnp_Tc3_2 domain-containing protein [Trichonephila clavipes]